MTGGTQLGNGHVDRAGAGVEVPVAVAAIGPLWRPLALSAPHTGSVSALSNAWINVDNSSRSKLRLVVAS
jgi:hypothetical protein